MSPAGVADTRSSNADATSPHDLLLADNTGSTSHSQEVFRLEWFSVLAIMLLLSICELIISVLIMLTNPRSIDPLRPAAQDVELIWQVAVIACSMIWCTLTVYTGFFVFLTEYHNAVGELLDRVLFLPHRVQQMSLRVVAYSYGVLWITGLGGFLFFFLFSDKNNVS